MPKEINAPPWGETVNDTEGLDFATSETVNPIVQTVRNLGPAGVIGSLPLWAPDGTNCTRGTVGLPMMGTAYGGINNIDHLGEIGEELEDVIYPQDANYEYQPADLEVWDDGKHVFMRTENGGRIQVGASVNGIHETDNPNELYDYKGKKPDYVVRLGNYTPNYDPDAADKAIDRLYDGYKNMEKYRVFPYLDQTAKYVKDPRYTETVQNRVADTFNKNLHEYGQEYAPYRREGTTQSIKNYLKDLYSKYVERQQG